VAGQTFKIDVDYRQLRRELRRADAGLKSELAAANKELAASIVDKALPQVPVRSGRLRASVRGLGNQAGAVGKAGGARVPYAAAIHWGRKQGGFIPARPFLRNAAKQVETQVVQVYEKRIRALFKRVSR
jgi:HK97 gp10 family phage protein